MRRNHNDVADADDPTFDDARPQAAAADQRLEHRLVDQLLQVLTRRAILDPFEQHVANAEPLAQEWAKLHPTGGQIATVLVSAEHNPVLSPEHVEDFGLEQRDLAGARSRRAGGVKADPGEVPIASQPRPSYSRDLAQRLHGFAGSRSDMDRLDLSHNCRSITNLSFTLYLHMENSLG